MVDYLNSSARSALMAKVKGKDTAPELVVRRTVHAMGYRYRLHRRDLPGSPDLVFPSRKKAIFVHGCFWHRHNGCSKTTTPKTRIRFWNSKFEANIARDRRSVAALRDLGWKTLVLWECGVYDTHRLRKQLRKFLG